jgi:diaminohydroxyphosphoribosylaminopyrimidine deaminase / 5-amino-6-(5-phosphoribosylamino)uracil reductase
MLPIKDELFMRRALDLAAGGLGRVEPNPMVGAVVVKDGVVVGEGYHQQFGGPHAEVHALNVAGPRARGATLYVTLEPCCHFGKTPPCTDAIIAAGVSRVVCAMIDPFPKVSGGGVKVLRKQGVAVDVGMLEAEAQDLNKAFLKRVETGKPFVIAKWAQSLDGAVATASGESQWISSPQSRQAVHVLRGRVDAVIVGLGTVLKDDPMLTARPANAEDIKRTAVRVVFDSQCRLPIGSQLVKTARQVPVLVACCKQLSAAARRRAEVLRKKGINIVALRATGKGSPRPRFGGLLAHLHALGHANVLLEGGPHLLAAALREQEVDEAHIFIAPKVIPGTGAIRPILGPALRKLADAPRFEIISVADSGGDIYAIAQPLRR